MSLIPDPFSDFLVNRLEKEVVNAVFSAAMSGMIAFFWSSKIARWLGLGPVATVMYLSLQQQVEKKALSLAVPKTLLDDDNLSLYETEFKT